LFLFIDCLFYRHSPSASNFSGTRERGYTRWRFGGNQILCLSQHDKTTRRGSMFKY